MSDLLMIMNPRQIEECVRSIAALDVDKAWLTGYREYELIPVIWNLVAETDYDRYIIVSDDVVVTPPALRAVQRAADDHAYAVVTGWCNLDMTDRGLAHSNVVRTPFTEYASTLEQYDWVPTREILDGDPVRLTWFAGLCLTCMTRDQWQTFPFDLFGSRGCCSDFELSWRLQHAGVPVLAVRDGGAFHVKKLTGILDHAGDHPLGTDERKRLVLLDGAAHVRQEERA
jgi:hypothetical protein